MLRRARYRLAALTLLAALILAAGGCAPEEPRPLEEPPRAEELRKAEEARRRAEEEARKRAEAERLARERREAERVREAFGPIGELPSVERPPEPPQIPFDEAVPPLPDEPLVRVAVLSNAGQPEKGQQVALIIGTYQKQIIERRLGRAVKIAYISHIESDLTRDSVIHFRENFFEAAVSVASVLPREQEVLPMTDAERRQRDVDLFVYVGKDYK